MNASRWTVCVNAGLALCSAIGLVASWVLAKRDAAAEVREYGRNVDSGGYVLLAGAFILLPAMILLSLAAIGFWRQWPERWLFQGLAVAWCLWPLLMVLAG